MSLAADVIQWVIFARMSQGKQSVRIPALLAGMALAAASSSGNPEDVIGKPFRVSESVKSYCAMQPPVMMCVAFGPQLAEFMREEREASWAVPAEMLIEKSMRVGGQRRVEIRALECRHTLCALEYAVPVDDLDHDADGSEELERLMEPVGGVVVPELPTGSGKGKFVSVLFWRKR